MTKKEQILSCALELFAVNGYNASSTSTIAKNAGVSEGLIFRHFGNKKGLLEAILKQGEERFVILITDILIEPNSSEAIRKSILLPFTIKKSEYHFWQLQFMLKWQKEYNNPQKLKPWIDKLAQSFTALKYDDPKMEATNLSMIIESTSVQLMRNELKNKNEFKNYLLKKYKIKTC